ncbi:MAG: hypothetical protein IJL02_09280 [Methanobrevibacter sp.]|uniref:hypothetical protein n=1 Tax=Methanobrevibacter sp. TaxID=66852 RepID=UPI0025CC58B7|nr:hypothetical protein [Methanobrevibacter sp.]MBQ6100032.1 hypothetical protein [Methanobrevibacter sp.]
MNGELDLELYTISIIGLNNALETLDKTSFEEISNNLEEFYQDVINDLNQEEIQMNDYYMFFENGRTIFPQYIETLKKIDNDELKESLTSLINTFENLNKIVSAFPAQQEMIQ